MEKLRRRDRVWSTRVADGHAYYYVRSVRPLVFSHIPYLDEYDADPALLRGLLPEVVIADIAYIRQVREYMADRETRRERAEYRRTQGTYR